MPFQNEKKKTTRLYISFSFCLFLVIVSEARCEIIASQIGQMCVDALKGEAEFLYVDGISPIQSDGNRKELILLTGSLAGSGDTSLLALLRTPDACSIVLSADGRGISVDKTNINGYPNIKTYHSEGKDEETGAFLSEDVTYCWNGEEYEKVTLKAGLKKTEKSANAKRETDYYRGAIGDYSITMKLTISAGEITGEYIYDNKGRKIEVKGNRVKHRFEMSEFYERKRTGMFTGQYNPQTKKIEGVWRKTTGASPLPFTLDVVELSEYGFPKVAVDNPANNQALQLFLVKSMAGEYSIEAHEANEMSYDIAYHSENLISILFTYTSQGGAHSNTGYQSLNISVTDGRASSISLESLFKKKSDYVKILSGLCKTDLKKQEAELYEKEFSKRQLDVFNLTADSIRFFFAPYVVGSYAVGSYFVSIPL